LATEGGPDKQEALLKHFRADNIGKSFKTSISALEGGADITTVRDCEAIRKILTTDYPEEKKKWSIMGQSFGGFCCVTYLSACPEGLREVFTTGGLPPLVRHPDLVYKYLFRKVAERNLAYYSKYPEDVGRVKEIVRLITKSPKILLPCGGTLSVLRLRQLGMLFGFHGCLDTVHEMICRFTSDLNQFKFFTRPTLTAFGSMVPFDAMPLYALIHEPIYARG